jgi:hypothetical protein
MRSTAQEWVPSFRQSLLSLHISIIDHASGFWRYLGSGKYSRLQDQTSKSKCRHWKFSGVQRAEERGRGEAGCLPRMEDGELGEDVYELGVAGRRRPGLLWSARTAAGDRGSSVGTMVGRLFGDGGGRGSSIGTAVAGAPRRGQRRSAVARLDGGCAGVLVDLNRVGGKKGGWRTLT